VNGCRKSGSAGERGGAGGPLAGFRATANRLLRSREEEPHMRLAAVTAMLCLGLAAAAAAEGTKVTKGQQLFTDQKCTLCHSIGDKGNKKGPLDDVAAKLSADEIRSWITDAKGMTAKTKPTRKPEMKQFNLPKDDVDALVAYLESLKK
jgi:mono/diheme cytochrome c family protein